MGKLICSDKRGGLSDEAICLEWEYKRKGRIELVRDSCFESDPGGKAWVARVAARSAARPSRDSRNRELLRL
jgi:hypothetical protein